MQGLSRDRAAGGRRRRYNDRTGNRVRKPVGEHGIRSEGGHGRTAAAHDGAERSGRDVGSLDFYIAFGFWKLACILEGVYSRYAAGAGGGDRTSFEGFADQVTRLAEAARDAAALL